MSETSSLSELARFVGESRLVTADAGAHRVAVNAITSRLGSRLPRRGVGELLSAVMALSARTRRMLLPPVRIELDVFAPDGARAVRVTMPTRSA